VEYDPGTHRYFLTPEQAFALTNEENPVAIPGAYYTLASVYKDQRRVADAIRAGRGFGRHEQHVDRFTATRKFFRPGHLADLVSAWLPNLDGVAGKLTAGARVADVGCVPGGSTILMAKAFPKSTFFGDDYRLESIEWARNQAVTDGVSSNTDFEVASAARFPRDGCDLVPFFDCLHDMGDPVEAARHVREVVKPDGTWMVVEPFAKERYEETLKSPRTRALYNLSLLVCVPASLSQDVGLGLGAQASDSALEVVFREGGFTRIRKAVETPMTRVFEVRPSPVPTDPAPTRTPTRIRMSVCPRTIAAGESARTSTTRSSVHTGGGRSSATATVHRKMSSRSQCRRPVGWGSGAYTSGRTVGPRRGLGPTPTCSRRMRWAAAARPSRSSRWDEGSIQRCPSMPECGPGRAGPAAPSPPRPAESARRRRTGTVRPPVPRASRTPAPTRIERTGRTARS
jgi:SAM-dependent methyltransferase